MVGKQKALKEFCCLFFQVSPLQWSFGSSPTTGHPALFAHNGRSCTGMDISNRTYEAVLISSQPGPHSSNSEEIPPPLPIKKPIRACMKTKLGQNSMGKHCSTKGLLHVGHILCLCELGVALFIYLS